VKIPAQLVIRERTYPVVIQNITRFGAFVTGLPVVERDSIVELLLPLQGPASLNLAATIVHWMNDETAARVGTVSGAGLRFHVPIDDVDTTFGAAITCLIVHNSLATQVRATEKATRPMLEPVRASLVAAMRVAAPPCDGRLVFAGLLAAVALPDLLMTLAQRRTCGRLELRRDHVTATVDLRDGDIVGARSSEHGGDPRDIVWRLLSWRDGSFRLMSGIANTDRGPRMRVSQLLIEHVHVSDEALPPIPAVKFR
jgi:hypothetical protein